MLDAADRADDHLRTVVGLAAGRLGGATSEGRSWFGRRLADASARLGVGEGRVAVGLAARYGPDQLDKAASEVERLVAGLDRLRATGECPRLVERLDDVGVRRLPEVLRSAPPGGPALHEIQVQVSTIVGAVTRARVELALGERRPPPASDADERTDQDGWSA